MKTPISLLISTTCAALTLALPVTSLFADDGKEAALSAPEQQYLQAIVKDNLGEIATAYLAIEKSSSNDVKSYALSLIDTHTKTMKQVMEMASRHNAFLLLEPDLSAYQTLMKQGGSDFDKAYLAEAQRLNQKAIDQLNPLMGQLTASDVKSFAQDDLKDDQKHLKNAQELAGKLQ